MANGYLTNTTNYNSTGTTGGTSSSSNTGSSSSTTKTTNTPTMSSLGSMYAGLLSNSVAANTPTYNNYTTPNQVSYTTQDVPTLTLSDYSKTPSLQGAGTVRGASDINKYLNSAAGLIKQGATGTTDYANNVINALTQQYQQNLPKTVASIAPQVTGLGAGLSQKLLGEQLASALADLGVNTSNTLLNAYDTQKANELAAGQAMGNLAGYVNQASSINTQADTATNAAKAALNNALTQLYGQQSTNVSNQNQNSVDAWAKLLANNQATSQGQLAAQVANNDAIQALNNILLGQNQLDTSVYQTQTGAQNAMNALYAGLAQALIGNQQTSENTGTSSGTTTGSQTGTQGTQGTQTTQTPNPLAGIDWNSIFGGGSGTTGTQQTAQDLLNSLSGSLTTSGGSNIIYPTNYATSQTTVPENYYSPFTDVSYLMEGY